MTCDSFYRDRNLFVQLQWNV